MKWERQVTTLTTLTIKNEVGAVGNNTGNTDYPE